jgi:phage gp16-like protein
MPIRPEMKARYPADWKLRKLAQKFGMREEALTLQRYGAANVWLVRDDTGRAC